VPQCAGRPPSPPCAHLLGAALALALPAAALAASSTDSFEVRAHVQPNCAVVASDIDFGVYDPGNDSEVKGELEIFCTRGTRFAIYLGPGEHGTILDRRMSNGREALPYNLYTSSTHRNVWGDATTGSYVSDRGKGRWESFTIHGLIESGHVVGGGTYTDQVVVTVEY
jgi:spore coat protein U-like protein